VPIPLPGPHWLPTNRMSGSLALAKSPNGIDSEKRECGVEGNCHYASVDMFNPLRRPAGAWWYFSLSCQRSHQSVPANPTSSATKGPRADEQGLHRARKKILHRQASLTKR
jgi:hypothetical protein